MPSTLRSEFVLTAAQNISHTFFIYLKLNKFSHNENVFFFHMVVSHVEINILFAHVISHAQLEVKSFAFQFHTLNGVSYACETREILTQFYFTYMFHIWLLLFTCISHTFHTHFTCLLLVVSLDPYGDRQKGPSLPFTSKGLNSLC